MSAFLLYCPSQIICQLSCTSFKKFHCNCLFQEACLVWNSCLWSGAQHLRLRPPTQCLWHVKHHSCASSTDDTNIGWFPYFLFPPCHLSKQKDSLSHCLIYLPSWVPRFMPTQRLHPGIICSVTKRSAGPTRTGDTSEMQRVKHMQTWP